VSLHARQLQYDYRDPHLYQPLGHLTGTEKHFDSFGEIRFTSDLIRLLTFIQTRYLPCIYIGPAALRLCGRDFYTYEDVERKSVPGASLVVREFKRGLSDPRNAPGWVASHLPAVFQLLSADARTQFEDVAARIRAQSFRQLREDLDHHHRTGASDVSLVVQIVHMFKAGVMEDQQESARVHAWALKKLDSIFIDQPTLALDLFIILMYNDNDYSVHKLRHSLG
jgi:hypothetical protein